MNKRIIITIAALFGVLLLAQTNPGTEEHKAAVKAKAMANMKERLGAAEEDGILGSRGAGLASLLSSAVLDKVIDIKISRTSYVLFSTTNFAHGKQNRVIGVGVLGNVFLSSKVDEVLKRDNPFSGAK
jgi:hypothetical protein